MDWQTRLRTVDQELDSFGKTDEILTEVRRRVLSEPPPPNGTASTPLSPAVSPSSAAPALSSTPSSGSPAPLASHASGELVGTAKSTHPETPDAESNHPETPDTESNHPETPDTVHASPGGPNTSDLGIAPANPATANPVTANPATANPVTAAPASSHPKTGAPASSHPKTAAPVTTLANLDVDVERSERAEDAQLSAPLHTVASEPEPATAGVVAPPDFPAVERDAVVGVVTPVDGQPLTLENDDVELEPVSQAAASDFERAWTQAGFDERQTSERLAPAPSAERAWDELQPVELHEVHDIDAFEERTPSIAMEAIPSSEPPAAPMRPASDDSSLLDLFALAEPSETTSENDVSALLDASSIDEEEPTHSLAADELDVSMEHGIALARGGHHAHQALEVDASAPDIDALDAALDELVEAPTSVVDLNRLPEALDSTPIESDASHYPGGTAPQSGVPADDPSRPESSMRGLMGRILGRR